MKRGISVFLSVTMLVMVLVSLFATHTSALPQIWDGTTASEFDGGDGTAANPYRIANGSQLAYLASISSPESTEGVHYILTADIILNDTSDWQTWSADNRPANVWDVISTGATKYFKGVFDGNGHTISGAYTNRDGLYGGIFGRVVGATIKNLHVRDSFFYSTKGVIGGIVGFAEENSIITNCSSSATILAKVSGTDARIGGIVGSLNESVVSYCYFSGSVTAEGTGSNYGRSVGGIVGVAATGGNTITQCFNVGPVYANYVYASGIAGRVEGTSGATSISDCYNTGPVNGFRAVGGIVGSNGYENLTIKNCYTTGELTARSTDPKIGGFIGQISKLTLFENCYYSTDSGVTEAAYLDSGSAGTDITGIMALTLAQMTGVAASTNMSELDYEGTWSVSSESLPTLKSFILTQIDVYYPLGVSDVTDAIVLKDGVVQNEVSYSLASFTVPVSETDEGATLQLLISFDNEGTIDYLSYVYFIIANDATLIAQEQAKLANLLGYVGVAIRTNDTYGRGLRFKSSISLSVRDDEMDQYNIIEYGTLAKRADNATPLVYIEGSHDELNRLGKGVAFLNGEFDYVFETVDDQIHFTSVLVNISQATADYAFRSYCCVEYQGNTYVVYGYEVTKSIRQVAELVVDDLDYFNSLSEDEKSYILSLLS